jgi:hypothetical protein
MKPEYRAMTLEEQVLRVLYDAPASARACCAEGLCERPDSDEAGVLRALAELQDRQCIAVAAVAKAYRITVAGSERLATLTEERERALEAVRA